MWAIISPLQDKDLICNEPHLYENIRDWAISRVKKHITIPSSFYDDYLQNLQKLSLM
jgi:hypothetical protein